MVSILDVMETEFAARPGFAAWYCQERTTLWGRGFGELNRIRNAIIHDRNLAGRLSTGISGTIVMHSGNIHVGGTPLVTPTLTYLSPQQTYRWYWTFQGNTEPVTDTCDRYFNLLKQMVQDCESRFR